MMELAQLIPFSAASLALVAFPGPNLIYILARSVGHGRRAGIVSALGVETGTLVHVTTAALGLSSLIAASALAFSVLKYAGAAYLLYLGVRALLRPSGFDVPDDAPPLPSGRAFLDGVVVNVLNPKVALFFVAFLPQFATPGADDKTARSEMLLLGLVFFAIALCVDLAYALAGDAMASRIRRGPGHARFSRWIVGGVYLGLGAYAALASGTRQR